MGCSPSKLDGLPAVALCRDRCNSLEETLRRSYALADAHSAYLLSLNTVGPALHRFFDQAVESPPDVDSDANESPDTSSPESSSPTHSVSTSSDSDLPPKFDSDNEEDGNKGKYCHLFRNHEPFHSRNYESGINTPPPPPPPPSTNAWDFINFFESYEFPYNTNLKELKDKETTRCNDEDKPKKKNAPIRKNDEKIRREEDKCVLKILEKKKKLKPEKTREPKDQKVSSDFSEVTKQWQEMFKEASEAGSEVSKMLDTSRFRYYQKTSVYQASSNVLYAKKMTPVEDFGSSFSNLSSTLKKLFMWEKKLYQEVKAEEKLRTSHMKRCKELRRLEGKSTTDVNKLESIRSSIQCLSTRITVSIQMIDNICLMINKLRDEELWSQIKKLIHRLSEMWSSMLECHSRQSRVIAEAKKLDKMTFKGNLDISQLELAMELKLELRNWSQSLSNWIDAQDQYVKALNSWLMRCLKQEPQEPTPDLSEEPPLFGAVNSWSLSLGRSDGEKEFTEAVYALLMQISRQVEKRRMELEEQRTVNGGDKDAERKLVMLEKEEQKMQRKMKTVPSVELMGSLNLKANMVEIFKCVEKLSTNLKQSYEEVDLTTPETIFSRFVGVHRETKMANVERSSLVDSRSGFCKENSTFYSKRNPISLPASPSLHVTTFISCQTHSGTTAFIDAATGQRLSFSDLWRAVDRVAECLHRDVGLRRGDVILILSPNSFYIPIVCLAVMSLGAVVTTANTLSTVGEISKQIADSNPTLAFTTVQLAHKLPAGISIVLTEEEHVEPSRVVRVVGGFSGMMKKEPSGQRVRDRVNQEDTAVMLYSSGTTGASKGVISSHRNLTSYVAKMVAKESLEDKILICTVPMFHTFGLLMFAMATVALGSTVVILRRFELSDMLAAVEKYRATALILAPPVLVVMTNEGDIIKAKYDLSSLKKVTCGGAPLSKEAYALTESNGGGAYMDMVDSRRYGTVGTLTPDVEARIVDPNTGRFMGTNQTGELWLKGPSISKGYFKNQEATSETFNLEGWLKTGDLCYIDDDGFLYVVDRLKELIKYKGYQVAPAELEALLITHPDILDAAVIPFPDKEAGQYPMAYVTRTLGSNLSEKQVIDFISKQVAPYKKIRKVAFINSIPKTASGKILRKDLIKLPSSKL
uniref:Uncharacterized protein n=1 Tax=Brassica campestris TaxID=3711 RepID=M4EAL4_BRACM